MLSHLFSSLQGCAFHTKFTYEFYHIDLKIGTDLIYLLPVFILHFVQIDGLLYVVFLKVAYDNKLRFFYGNNEEPLLNDLKRMGDKYERAKERGKELNYVSLASATFKTIPDQYHEHLLRQLCSNFRSLTDAGLCWLEPCDIDDSFDEIEEAFDYLS